MTPTHEDVAKFLQEHPEFFEQYADLLAEIYIPHPHGGRAIPISERQILTLREKNRMLETKLRELIQFGEENDALSEKLHRLTLALVAAANPQAALGALRFHLVEDFHVPHVALRVWVEGLDDLPEAAPVGEEVKLYAASLGAPSCGHKPMFDTPSWFGEAGSQLASFAYVALGGEKPVGLLVLASEDAQRFYPEMGTLYLKRLGDLAAAVLQKPAAPAD